MCVGKAALVIRGQDRPVFMKEHNHHEPMIAALKLRDDAEPIARHFARVEVKPLDTT